MRTNNILPAGLVFFFFIIGCSRVEIPTTGKLLEDPVQRSEIMTAICNDREMTGEIMEHITKNKYAIQLLDNDYKMIRNMLENNGEIAKGTMQHLIDMMRKDSVFCENMSFMMMNDEHMRIVICNMCDCSPESDKEHKNTH
ncbi:hypothetical protein ED312_12600 [Sinomicrobium pectinilyticum]|uniref:Uncharacterized protein n=1 Tax=Sinomicrobium pectinilyticum TaxID=1084421 RepID=A0A3N0EC34_SINP1|nr:hypothetical protein [Sinomicrobium pectinilyticum]RNL85374.1 hypothetical protein ED312_12600 [Sinomicrobium pectinilyticum]